MNITGVDVSPRMQRILERAAQVGEEHTGRRFLGTENVLRALTEDTDGAVTPSIANRVLDELGIRERLRDRLDEWMRSNAYRTSSRQPGAGPERSP